MPFASAANVYVDGVFFGVARGPTAEFTEDGKPVRMDDLASWTVGYVFLERPVDRRRRECVDTAMRRRARKAAKRASWPH